MCFIFFPTIYFYNNDDFNSCRHLSLPFKQTNFTADLLQLHIQRCPCIHSLFIRPPWSQLSKVRALNKDVETKQEVKDDQQETRDGMSLGLENFETK